MTSPPPPPSDRRTAAAPDPMPAVDGVPEPPSLPGRAHEATARAPTDNRLRVLVFSDSVPGRNGVGTFYDDLARVLEPHVGAIRVIAPTGTDAGSGRSIPLPGDPTQRLYMPRVRRIWTQVRWTKPHVVLCATPSAYGVLGMIFARRLGTGAALCYHTQFAELAGESWGGIRGRFMSALLGWWDRMLVRRSAHVLAPNSELAEALARMGRGDARVMSTLAPPSFVEAPVAAPPAGIRSVGFIGRLSPEKRLDQVIEAARRHPDLDFRVVGEGPLRSEVEQAASTLPNLTHAPWLERAEVMAALDRTDLLVLPSLHETFGTAAFESMVRGRLTLVSPACGIADWEELRPGFVILKPDEELHEGIGRMRAMPAARLRDLATTARRASLSLHSRATAHWLDLLEDLAADRGR